MAAEVAHFLATSTVRPVTATRSTAATPADRSVMDLQETDRTQIAVVGPSSRPIVFT